MAELTRRVGISEQTFYRWKKQYAVLETDQVREFKQLAMCRCRDAYPAKRESVH